VTSGGAEEFLTKFAQGSCAVARQGGALRCAEFCKNNIFNSASRWGPFAKVCIDQTECRFAQTYCGEAAKQFWGYPLGIARILEKLASGTNEQTTTTRDQTNIKQTTLRMTI
jgi:hypothetical protein